MNNTYNPKKVKELLSKITEYNNEDGTNEIKSQMSNDLHMVKYCQEEAKLYKSKVKDSEKLIKLLKGKAEGMDIALNKIKKLKFISKVSVITDIFGVNRLEIKTKDLILKGNNPPDFNAGPYLIQFYENNGFRVFRERLWKYRPLTNNHYNHCFSDYKGEVCFGGNWIKFRNEIALGRYDTALTMLWNMLTDVSPNATSNAMIGYPSLISDFTNAELKISKAKKQKQDKKEVKENVL